jgi:MoaA/NifB/PqqE/SkfB family radical SAM enzyme
MELTSLHLLLTYKCTLQCDHCFADACHLCYRSREMLRSQLPEILAPDQVYGQPMRLSGTALQMSYGG